MQISNLHQQLSAFRISGGAGVIVPFHGEIDFSRDDIPIEICKELYEKGFPYLELTETGKQELNFQVTDPTDQPPAITKTKKKK